MFFGPRASAPVTRFGGPTVAEPRHSSLLTRSSRPGGMQLRSVVGKKILEREFWPFSNANPFPTLNSQPLRRNRSGSLVAPVPVAKPPGGSVRRRAHHLAKELGVPLEDLVRAAEHGLNMEIRSTSVLLKEKQIQVIRASLTELGLSATT